MSVLSWAGPCSDEVVGTERDEGLLHFWRFRALFVEAFLRRGVACTYCTRMYVRKWSKWPFFFSEPDATYAKDLWLGCVIYSSQTRLPEE